MIRKAISIAMLLVSVLLLCFSVACWFIGFHNADQAHDLTISTLQMGKNPESWELCTDEGKCYSYFDCYSMGILLMKKSIFLIIITSFLTATSAVIVSSSGVIRNR
jgi:hypothetical protein